MKNDFMQWALTYASKGLAVFPVSREKRPCIKNGSHMATTDASTIRAWWTEFPDANIAIATGKISGGIYVIDVDLDEEKGKDGYETLAEWEAENGELPKSWESITGRGGKHYIFHSNKSFKNQVDLYPGIDIRGEGGYFVAFPSVHLNGNQYEWECDHDPDEVPLAELNPILEKFLKGGKNKKSEKKKTIIPTSIQSGSRNDTLFRIACSLQSSGLSDDAIKEAMTCENIAKCNPPVDDRELANIIAQALKYEKGSIISIDDVDPVKQQLHVDGTGKILKTLDNFMIAIESDPKLSKRICFNELSETIIAMCPLPWDASSECRTWTDTDDSELMAYVQRHQSLYSEPMMVRAIDMVAKRNAFNPVKNRLASIYEDYGESKGEIKSLLTNYLGLSNEYSFEVLKLFMLGAICRIWHPGCKFDYSLIIKGKQGFGKSTFLRRLALDDDWYNDNFNTFEGSEAYEKLSGKWIVEMAELKALKSARDSEIFKSFLTSQNDTYRAPYARRTLSRPRKCVFSGTTNNYNIFVDRTGNRRFLVIEVNDEAQRKSLFDDSDEVVADFEKAWAEAMHIFKEADEHPKLVLPKSMEEEAERMQDKFMEDDWRIGKIKGWLEETDCARICVPQIVKYALERDPTTMNKKELREISEILDEMEGWERKKNKNGGRNLFPGFGRQVSYNKIV